MPIRTLSSLQVVYMLIKNSGALWYWGVYTSTMALYLQMYMYLHCRVYIYIDVLRTTVSVCSAQSLKTEFSSARNLILTEQKKEFSQVTPTCFLKGIRTYYM